jgi:hypothetical protein
MLRSYKTDPSSYPMRNRINALRIRDDSRSSSLRKGVHIYHSELSFGHA